MNNYPENENLILTNTTLKKAEKYFKEKALNLYNSQTI